MQQIRFTDPKRRLNFPIYKLSETKSRQKSCFIDSNRVDTVRLSKSTETKKD